jgi:DNA-directed RNA polymerase subunit RPC12/RpoP
MLKKQKYFRAILDLMERGGLICRNCEGKIFMTKKGQEKQVRT